MKISKTDIDVAATFLVFVAVCGDVERCALAMDMDPAVVRALSEQEQWVSKLKRVSLMSKSEVPGEYEKACNRAIMFLQGHAIRSIVQRVCDTLSRQDGNQLLASLAQTKAGQVTYSAKFLAELSQASERANYMCLNALGDTVSERESEREGGEGKLNMSEVHASVLNALNHGSAVGAERHLLEQNVEDLVRKNVPPKPTEEQ